MAQQKKTVTGKLPYGNASLLIVKKHYQKMLRFSLKQNSGAGIK